MRQHMANYLFLARTQGVPVVLGKHDPHLARTFGLTLSGPEMGKLQWVTKNVSFSCQDPPKFTQSVSFMPTFRVTGFRLPVSGPLTFAYKTLQGRRTTRSQCGIEACDA